MFARMVKIFLDIKSNINQQFLQELKKFAYQTSLLFNLKININGSEGLSAIFINIYNKTLKIRIFELLTPKCGDLLLNGRKVKNLKISVIYFDYSL